MDTIYIHYTVEITTQMGLSNLLLRYLHLGFEPVSNEAKAHHVSK